jgi:hypothetical protein
MLVNASASIIVHGGSAMLRGTRISPTLYVMSSKEVRMHEQKRKIVGHNIY